MINTQNSASKENSRVMLLLRAAAVACAAGVTVSACSNTAFESKPVDDSPSTGSEDQDVSVEADTDEPADDELALVAVDSPYDEPDIEAVLFDEEIPENAADEPDDEPTSADPADTADVTQVALGTGESALCATVQIGRDAASDGGTELLATQQAMLIDRVDLTSDDELSELIGGIDAAAPVELTVLDAALARCEDLGYQP